MLSPDGHTRPFDEQANGTVFSDGAAIVVLRRLSDALAARRFDICCSAWSRDEQ